MCKGKKITASAVEKVVIYTLSDPFKKGKPGYVSRSTPSYSGDVVFTDDIWDALAQDRNAINAMLPGLRQRTNKALFTHLAVAMLYDAEALTP